MSERLMTLATFSHPIEAHVAKTKLESEGIECFMVDENIVALNWLYSGAVGGIKLQVRESDFQSAERILKPASPDFSLRTAEPSPVKCPHCGSSDVAQVSPWLRIFHAGLGRPRTDQRCRQCGRRW